MIKVRGTKVTTLLDKEKLRIGDVKELHCRRKGGRLGLCFWRGAQSSLQSGGKGRRAAFGGGGVPERSLPRCGGKRPPLREEGGAQL